MTKLALLLLAGLLPALHAADNPAVAKAVIAAANDLSKAQMNKDKAAMERLLGDELVYSHSSGMRETKAQHIAATTKPTNHYESISLTDTKVMAYGDTAILTCTADISTNNDGKKGSNHLSMLQTWVKRGSGWQLVARWTTRLP